MNAGSRAHQVVRFMESSSTEPDLKLSIQSFACAFNIDHPAVKQALLRVYEDPSGADDTESFHPKSSTPW
jgi:hypothetical protein